MSYYDPEALAEHKRRVQKAGGSTQDGLTPAQRQYQDQTGDLYRHLDAPPPQPRQVEYVGGFGRKPPVVRVNNSLVNQQNGAVQQITAIQQQLHRPAAAPPRQALAAPPQQSQRLAQAPQPARPQPAQRPSGGGAKMPAGGPNVAPPPRPEQQLGQQGQQGQQRQNEMQSLQQAHAATGSAMRNEGLAQYHDSIKAANQAIADEMQSRVDQSREWDKMQHEQGLAAMAHQTEMAKHQGQMQMQQQEIASRNARNSALMKAAGIGGYTIVNGQRVDPFSSIRQSLLG